MGFITAIKIARITTSGARSLLQIIVWFTTSVLCNKTYAKYKNASNLSKESPYFCNSELFFFLNFLLLLRRIIGSEVTVSVFLVICYLYQSSKPQEVARISDFLINA